MIIRFQARNIFSFNEEIEFNLFPNRTQKLKHHKVEKAGFEFLRFSAFYGANGSGKSNIVKAIDLLAESVRKGEIPPGADAFKFRLNTRNAALPTSLAMEFSAGEKVFYYAVTWNNGTVLSEYLAESLNDNDEMIFERTADEHTQRISLAHQYSQTDKQKLFAEVISDVLQKREMLITFLGKRYAAEFPDVSRALQWFTHTITVIGTGSKPQAMAHLIDISEDVRKFANTFVKSLSLGVSSIEVEKKNVDEFFGSQAKNIAQQIAEHARKSPEHVSTVRLPETDNELSVACEGDEVVVKSIKTKHADAAGEEYTFDLAEESDGTRRLIDYIPALVDVINNEKVYVIDEIERSIHPITIKEIIKKLSHDQNIKGQLIFTTHESNLLDQTILRPDEIWFVQKTIDGSSAIYSLSDFKIHNTLDVENGYLNGRYGGIPFLANLQDLSW